MLTEDGGEDEDQGHPRRHCLRQSDRLDLLRLPGHPGQVLPSRLPVPAGPWLEKSPSAKKIEVRKEKVSLLFASAPVRHLDACL
jgi:hypothetical protein